MKAWGSMGWAVAIGLATLAPVTTSGQTLITIANYNAGLVQSLKLADLSVTNVGSLGVGFSYGDLAWDSTHGVLYMVDGRGGSKALYTVDPATGVATLVGVHGVTDLFGLAYDSATNTLYGTSAQYFDGKTRLYKLDPATGAATLIGYTLFAGDIPSYIPLGGLAYDSRRDMLIGIRDGNVYGELYQVDINTGGVTLLASPGGTNSSGLTYDPVNDRLYDADLNGYLFSYDIANGYARTILLEGLLAHDGLAYMPAVIPEPAADALLGLGASAILLPRVRRRTG